MIKKISFMLVLVISLQVLNAREKEINKTIPVKESDKIEIEDVTGLDVKFIGWDKNEIKIDVVVNASSSDRDYLNEYLNEFDIIENRRGNTLVIEFDETNMEGGWSILDIFKGKFSFSFSKKIVGTIYVPFNNNLVANFRYSETSFDKLNGELELNGRSNDLYIRDCKNIAIIKNDYGENEIKSSGGNLELDTRSGNLNINEFDGDIKVTADYTEIRIYKVDGNIDLKSRSASIEIENVEKNITVAADYSDTKITEVKGMVNVKNRSGSIKAINVGGLAVDAPYTEVYANNVGNLTDIVSIENRSGGIELENIKSNLFVDDSYSNIKLKNIEGDVELRSRSATISAMNINGNWDSNTQYSTITLDKLNSNKIFVKNESEKIKLQLYKFPKDLKVVNKYADIDLTIPMGYIGHMEIDTRYGEINSDIPLSITTKNENSFVNERIGNGNSKINLSNSSGNIFITTK